MQTLSALQTFGSLKVYNMGHQGSLPNSIGVNMEQHGQGALCSNVSKLMGVVGTQATTQPPNSQ
jgi:hypothetical protein